ncbi:MAG: hypothetical protein IJS54_05205 [Desulfovibrio sp.]|nr:hypothetical protein [Desulfovibrio sp.]
MEKILTVLCGSFRPLCERRLLQAWKRNVSWDIFSEQVHLVFGSVDSEETLKERLFAEFLSFLGEQCKELETQPRIARFDEYLPPDELEILLSNIVNDLVDAYINKGVKEMMRSDPNTFNGLYRSVQRFAKDYLPDRLYGAQSQFVGRPGMDEIAFSEATSNAVPPYDKQLMTIPLPDHCPYIVRDFYEKSGRRRYVGKPFMDLLQYYSDAVESRGLGAVVQLRTFVSWVSAHYDLLPVIQSLSASDDTEDGESMASLKDEVLNAEERTICTQSAREIYYRMGERERRIFRAIYEGDTAADWQRALSLATEQQAYAEQRKLAGFLKANIEALPDLIACGEEAQEFFFEELYDFCTKAPLLSERDAEGV